MPRLPRLVAFAAVCVLALACSACKSDNEGKIVGKWKASAADLGVPGGADVIYEFTSGGRFSISGAAGSITGNYSLGSGATVNLSNISPPIEGKTKSREKIVISGDSMTLEGPGGKKVKLSRIN